MFTKIKIKASFFVVAAFCIKAGIFGYFLTVFALVLLHEFCHIFTAMLWDIKTSRITITPIGIYADMENLEYSIAMESECYGYRNYYITLICKDGQQLSI